MGQDSVDPARIFRFGEFQLDEGRLELRRQGNAVPLQPKPLRLLLYLLERHERFVSKEEIFEWWDAAVSDAAISSALKDIRRALEDDADEPRCIQTRRRIGYQFVGPVELEGAPSRSEGRTSVYGAPRGLSTAFLPSGWGLAGSALEDFEIGTESSDLPTGGRCGYLRSKASYREGFGTLMQTFGAAEWRGLRLKMSARCKTAGIDGWVGLWMRIDGKAGSYCLDNMQNRAITGTTEWTNYEVILDVPDESMAVAFGVLQGGTGETSVSDFRFQPVGTDVPTTDGTARSPQNLSFSRCRRWSRAISSFRVVSDGQHTPRLRSRNRGVRCSRG